jgi:hypothetical protein
MDLVFKGGERRHIFTAKHDSYRIEVYMMNPKTWAYTIWYGEQHVETEKSRQWNFESAKIHAAEAVQEHQVFH